MQQVGTAVGAGGEVAGLGQLQRRLQRRGVRVAACRGHHPVGEPVPVHGTGDRVRGFVEGACRERAEPAGAFAGATTDGVDEQVQRQQGGGVGLGRGHRLFRPGTDVHGQLGRLGQGGAGAVRHRERAGPLPAGRPGDLQQVVRAAALADRDEQDVPQVRTGPVQRRGGRGDQPGGQPEQDLDEVSGVVRGVVAGPTRGEQHEPRRTFGDTAGHRGELRVVPRQVVEHAGLLVDLRSHVVAGRVVHVLTPFRAGRLVPEGEVAEGEVAEGGVAEGRKSVRTTSRTFNLPAEGYVPG